MKNKSMSKPSIRPDRIRKIGEGTFGYIPHRFLRDGFFVSLGHIELALYLFLVLVADRNGISFYGYESICSVLEVTLDDYIEARDGLIRKDLIAFDGRRFQVLSLPRQPIVPESTPLETSEELRRSDPATIRRSILDSLS